MKTSQKKINLHDGLNFLNIEEKKINKRIGPGVHWTPFPSPLTPQRGFLFLFYIDKRKAWET